MPTIIEPDSNPYDRADKLKETHLYIVSPNTLQAQLLTTFLNSELGVPSFHNNKLSLKHLIGESADRLCICLFDCLGSGLHDIEEELEIGVDESIPGNVLIALYNIGAGIKLAALVKKYRIRGIFFRDDSQSFFIKGIKAILKGDLWLSRKLLSECILIPGEAANTQSVQELSQLSRREIQILKHVRNGASNQEIADTFNISLHTVKTHLYNVYKKINVSNRLQATLWAAANIEEHV
ncbi:MAG: LuxR C-terminal-related transcriptional regulator [Desulfobacteraceae bacterium]